MILKNIFPEQENIPPTDPWSILSACEDLDIRTSFEVAPPPLDFVVSGLKAGTVAILTSPGGLGKSILSIEMAMGIAAPGADQQLLDLGIKTCGRVLMLNAEDPADVLNERVHNIGKFLDDDVREAVFKNLTIKPIRGTKPNLLDARWIDAISKLSDGMRLVVMDTFSRFHSGDENSNQEMADVIGNAEIITERTGACIMFAHHSAKSAAMNKQMSSQQSTRGASSIVDNARWQAYLEGMDESEAKTLRVPPELRSHFVSFGVSKQNYGRPIAPRWLVKLNGGVLQAVQPGIEMADACEHLKKMIRNESSSKINAEIAANDSLARATGTRS